MQDCRLQFMHMDISLIACSKTLKCPPFVGQRMYRSARHGIPFSRVVEPHNPHLTPTKPSREQQLFVCFVFFVVNESSQSSNGNPPVVRDQGRPLRIALRIVPPNAGNDF